MARDESVRRALWIALAASALLRLAGMTAGTTSRWALDFPAYLPSWLAWSTWAVMAVALLPPVGAAFARALERVGRSFESTTRGARFDLFAIVAVALFFMPDRVGFTGDFLLRISSAKAAGNPATVFPQALPLDLWLHYTIPHELARLHLAPVEMTSRVLGALEAGVLALLVTALMRRANLHGSALAVATLATIAGAPLAIFTGLNKPFTELLVLAAAIALTTMPTPTPSFRRNVTTLALFILAMLLHRVALLLLPVVILDVVHGLRAHRATHPRSLLVILFLVAAFTVSLALRPIAHTDLPRGLLWLLQHPPSEPVALRLLDLGNLVLLIAPLTLLLPALRLDARTRDAMRTQTGAWAACLALPTLALVAFVDAPQGYFRDWDMFAIAGLLLTALVALALGRFLERTPRAAWLGGAIALATLVPCVQILAHNADANAGVRRVTALGEGEPARPLEQRASVLAFLAKRAWDHGDNAATAELARRSAQLVPTPSMLVLWADAERLQGNSRAAEPVYEELVARSPGHLRGWLGLARTRLAGGEVTAAATAAESALVIEPQSQEAAEILRAARRDSTARR